MDYSEKPAPEVKSRFEATWAGCIGGAMEEGAYFDLIKKAGFEQIRILAKHSLGPTELEEMLPAQAQNSPHVHKKRIWPLSKGR